MTLTLRRSKPVALMLIVLITAPCFLESRPMAPPQEKASIEKLLTDGEALYDKGEYEQAIKLFWEALGLTQSRSLRSRIYFQLALAYYSSGDEAACRANLARLFEIQPDPPLEVKELPSGFVLMISAEKSKTIKPEARSDSQPSANAFRAKKFPWLIVLGAAAVAAAVIIILITKKKSSDSPVLAVEPLSFTVEDAAGTCVFNIRNSGGGSLAWTVSVQSGGEWLSPSPIYGVGNGVVTVTYGQNPSTASRSGSIQVTANDAVGSPKFVTISQAGSTPQPVLSVSPDSRSVSSSAGATTFSVSNAGTGTMTWTAAVTQGDSWLWISAGASGTDSGTITAEFMRNTGTESRSATITVTANGAAGSPKDVTVAQAGEAAQNQAPNPPSSPSPADGANIGSAVSATLSWTCSDPDGDPLTYDVYFGSGTTPPRVSQGQTGTSYNTGNVLDNPQYYWRIVAFDDHGHSTSSPLWVFYRSDASAQPDSSGASFWGKMFGPDSSLSSLR